VCYDQNGDGRWTKDEVVDLYGWQSTCLAPWVEGGLISYYLWNIHEAPSVTGTQVTVITNTTKAEWWEILPDIFFGQAIFEISPAPAAESSAQLRTTRYSFWLRLLEGIPGVGGMLRVLAKPRTVTLQASTQFTRTKPITVTVRYTDTDVLHLYDIDGTTELAQNDNYGDTFASHILWQAPADGSYFVRVHHYSREAYGADTQYDIWVQGASGCGLLHDFDNDGMISMNDVAKVISHWRERKGDPAWDDQFDDDGDRQITVKDILAVSIQVGAGCLGPWYELTQVLRNQIPYHKKRIKKSISVEGLYVVVHLRTTTTYRPASGSIPIISKSSAWFNHG